MTNWKSYEQVAAHVLGQLVKFRKHGRPMSLSQWSFLLVRGLSFAS